VQLRKFSSSTYFDLEVMRWAYGHLIATRTGIVTNLVTLSRDFATRSVRHSRERQGLSTSTTGRDAVIPEWMDGGLVRWEDDNHTMTILHPAHGSITALYRRLDGVDPQVRQLFESQGKALGDYFAMSDAQLRQELALICDADPAAFGHEGYVLTPDNWLKIVMVILRVEAGLPVVIMGETGCGKTSLIRFAAQAKGASFHLLNVHAGRTEQDIVDFVRAAEAAAREEDKDEDGHGRAQWLFLDEINTCEHLGLINDLVCHRTLEGAPVSPRLVFLAACNPYRLKGDQAITAGLDIQQKRRPDALSRLVYRVHPLPETMLDYLWDFGSLQPEDEGAYIREILKGLDEEGLPPGTGALAAAAVEASQHFIRAREDRSAVSMRDVRRFKRLVDWFYRHKRARPRPSRRRTAFLRQQGTEQELGILAVVLALAHCYRSRLPFTVVRHEYDGHIAGVFAHRGMPHRDEAWIRREIEREQLDYLARMNLGPGIAPNEALLENVFVLLVCILLKMPVFLVGKPGSSKTLSMKRLESNLRGLDSEDDFFKQLNEIKVKPPRRITRTGCEA
jgi:E3 ubiquitin-protein ligase RNF213